VPRRRQRIGLTLERLEGRLAMSGGFPVNTIGVAHGNVPARHAVAEVSVPVSTRNLAQHRHSTLFTFVARPDAGSALNPNVRYARGPSANRLPFRHGAPYVPIVHPQDVSFTRDGQPGPLTAGVTGRKATTGPFTEGTLLPGDVNGDGHVDLADLAEFSKAFLSTSNDAFYKPSADANQNGFIGIGDAKFLERNLTPVTPKIPLKVDLHLAPGQQVLHPSVHTSGGITTKTDIVILGRTTPGSIAIADSALGNYSFDGKALPTDAKGNFRYEFHLSDQLTNFEFLVLDPFGQQTIRAFPVLLVKP
jgi:dockerin type I repeat protein